MLKINFLTLINLNLKKLRKRVCVDVCAYRAEVNQARAGGARIGDPLSAENFSTATLATTGKRWPETEVTVTCQLSVPTIVWAAALSSEMVWTVWALCE